MSPASVLKGTHLLLTAFKSVLKGAGKVWVDSCLCLLISFIHSDMFPGHPVKCFGIGGGNKPAPAPVRTCENQWCLDKLPISPDICSASSSSLSSAEHNNKKNKPRKRVSCACMQMLDGSVSGREGGLVEVQREAKYWGSLRVRLQTGECSLWIMLISLKSWASHQQQQRWWDKVWDGKFADRLWGMWDYRDGPGMEGSTHTQNWSADVVFYLVLLCLFL